MEDRQEQSEMALVESSAVRNLVRLPDAPEFVLRERAVLRKYDGEVAGMTPAEAKEALLEAIVIEDGVIVDKWTKGQDRDAPQD